MCGCHCDNACECVMGGGGGGGGGGRISRVPDQNGVTQA